MIAVVAVHDLIHIPAWVAQPKPRKDGFDARQYGKNDQKSASVSRRNADGYLIYVLVYSVPQMKQHQSLIWLLVILTGTAFLEELLVLFFLDMLPPMPKMAAFLLDATLLSVLIFPIFYFLVFRPMSQNITELRQAEESLRTVSVAFESKDPILITDAQANILRANKMFLNITGYSSEEIIGKNPRILKTGRYSADYYKKLWGQLLRDGSWAGETRIKDKRGYEIPVAIVITAVKNEQQETTHYVAIYTF
jgi:PAS domain S-box-containing protein